MKTGKMLLFVTIGLWGQGREKITITNPFRTDARAAIVEVSPLPKFTFALNKTFRIRKTDKAEMYEYNPKKPGKSYRHLMLFLELLEQETKIKLSEIDVIDVVVVTAREFHDLTEVDGFVWTEPLMEESARLKGSGFVWFVEEDIFKVFMVNLKDPARVLLLEKFLTHLTLLTEWELSVRNVSPEDTNVLVTKRKAEWEKREGKAFILFHRVSGHWRLLQLDWPSTLPPRPKVLSIPLPWPPWPRNSRQ